MQSSTVLFGVFFGKVLCLIFLGMMGFLTVENIKAMDHRMKLKYPKTWLRKWLRIDKQVQQNLLYLIKICFWCSRVEPSHEVYGHDLSPRCYIALPMYVRKKSSKFKM